MTTFQDLELGPEMLRAIEELGFEEPTPIQAQAIGPLLKGHDLVGQAQTGTGKTAAFAVPILDRIDPTGHYVQALVLVPTRELAVQVAEHAHRLGRYRSISVIPIYGGQSYDRQFRGLSHGAQVVVGTPGRIMDHLQRETLDLSRCRFAVLDEADQMLDMGFIEDVEWILQHCPNERQTALFSATMPPRIAALARSHLKDPVRVSVSKEHLTVSATDQRWVEVRPREKLNALNRILEVEAPSSAMIFCRTKRDVDDLGERLAARGFLVETIHGDLSQVNRERVLRRFRDGQVEIMVATDVAARGLDIQGVSHVINYDIPEDPEAYVHRIGRTGRAGREGFAITLVTPRELGLLRTIERVIGQKVKPMRLPTAADVAARRLETFRLALRDTIVTGEVNEFLTLVEDLREDFDLVEIAAAAIKMAHDARRKPGAAEPEEEAPANEPVSFSAGKVRLLFDVGKRSRVRPADLVGAIANEAGLSGRAIGAIEIYENHSFVDVPEDQAERIIGVLNGSTIRGRKIRPHRAD